MSDPYDLVLGLTSTATQASQRIRMLRDFAVLFGWQPSHAIADSEHVAQFATAHLVVEQGLEPSAVITFLNERSRVSNLNAEEHQSLLSLSYNSLADWHLCVEPEKVTYYFTRKDPLYSETREISRFDHEGLRRQTFEQIAGRRPNPNLKSLDNALVETISHWKRLLTAELETTDSTDELSILFNAILFTRAAEDWKAKRIQDLRPALLNELARSPRKTLENVIRVVLHSLFDSEVDRALLDIQRLHVFDSLSEATVHALFFDFYRNKYAPYDYDFSLISKHALSKVYEHYVSILHIRETPQGAFWPPVPDEEFDRSLGSVYTPEYIARFLHVFCGISCLPPILDNLKRLILRVAQASFYVLFWNINVIRFKMVLL